MKYDIKWLVEKYVDNGSIPLFLFWGHQPAKDGSITKNCLSQWWVAPFKVEGITYNTAEHWMMAGKARLFGDKVTLQNILLAETPAQAKELGRQVTGFDAGVWDDHKYELIVKGNWHKFSQHSDLKEFLVKTGEHVLVEASPVDTIWGIGLAADHPDARNPKKWKGQNLLGFALMEIREKLK